MERFHDCMLSRNRDPTKLEELSTKLYGAASWRPVVCDRGKWVHLQPCTHECPPSGTYYEVGALVRGLKLLKLGAIDARRGEHQVAHVEQQRPQPQEHELARESQLVVPSR